MNIIQASVLSNSNAMLGYYFAKSDGETSIGLVPVNSVLDCQADRQKIDDLYAIGKITALQKDLLIQNMHNGTLKEFYLQEDGSILIEITTEQIIETIDTYGLNLQVDPSDTPQVAIEKVNQAGYFICKTL